LLVVPNGIDLKDDVAESDRELIRSEYGIPADAIVVGTVGRLAEVKRQDRLLKAAAELSLGNRKLWVLIVGEGPERDRLVQLATSLGIQERVRLVGYQSQPNRFLRAMDLFVLTSRSEGLPISLLEAWASRLPVISTNVGGVPDVISEGIDGLIVPNDDGLGLAVAISKLLGDADSAKRLGMAGLKVVTERFSLATMARTYETEYRALISGMRGKA